MTERRIFISDIHGHYHELIHLIETIKPDTDDNIYFLGDLIDRGPDSAKVVDFVINSGYSCLMGNHEQMLLTVLGDDGLVSQTGLQFWLNSGGTATMLSYGEEGIPAQHIEWMKTLPTHLDLGDIWIVHAGVDPQLPLEEQSSEQFCWIRERFHCAPKPYFPDKLIITGHTITFTLPGIEPGKIAQGPGWLDIDTGVYHPQYGWLTALDMTNEQVYQVKVGENTVRILPLEEALAPLQPSFLEDTEDLLCNY